MWVCFFYSLHTHTHTHSFSTEFSHVNRTVCPVLKKSDNSTSLVEAFSNQTLFYIDVFTSSSVNVPYSIFIETVPNFELR